eukprot:Rhum_TRINITY_DN15574_c0_g1::Rhum_TRINITY_DN15574_c0_g1_i1::g.161311::m.161311
MQLPLRAAIAGIVAGAIVFPSAGQELSASDDGALASDACVHPHVLAALQKTADESAGPQDDPPKTRRSWAPRCPDGSVQVGELNNQRGVVCEELKALNGSFHFLYTDGSPQDTMAKRVYQQNMPGTWGGLQRGTVLNATQDLLAKLYTKGGNDPVFDKVLNTVPPILFGWGSKPGWGYEGQHTFVTSRQSDVEAVFDHTGDCGMFAGYPRPVNVMGPTDWNTAKNNVYEGLVGGSLLILQFTYILSASVRWEMTVVPIDNVDGNREQPVWFRFVRVSNNADITRQVVFDTYAYNPSGVNVSESGFYEALLQHKQYWQSTWKKEGTMTVAKPVGQGAANDPRTILLEQTEHSLIRDMVTRRDVVWPSYGVCGDPGGCAYGGPHNNGFQETFTASLTAALEWGNFAYAKGVLENWLEYYVRPHGNIHYRGLEMAQQGRTLTVTALYYFYTKDSALILKYLPKIKGVADLLLKRVDASKKLHPQSPWYGIPQGNDEADLWLEEVTVGPTHKATELPFYSIATETIRGFADIAEVISKVAPHDPYVATLNQASITMRYDLQASLAATFRLSGEKCYGYVAGIGACDNLPANLNLSTHDSEPTRTYAEMFYSNILGSDVVQSIVDWNANNSKMTRMGLLTGNGVGCCGNWIETFTSHGWAYGLLQNDLIPNFLMQLFAVSSHAYTRGTWTALESTSIEYLSGQPYCPVAQLSVPLSLKWMLLIDNSERGETHYAKGVPRDWFTTPLNLTHPTTIDAQNITSRYGHVSYYRYSVDPMLAVVTFDAQLNNAPWSVVHLRLQKRFKVTGVTTQGGAQLPFNSTSEAVYLDSTYAAKKVQLKFKYALQL